MIIGIVFLLYVYHAVTLLTVYINDVVNGINYMRNGNIISDMYLQI